MLVAIVRKACIYMAAINVLDAKQPLSQTRRELSVLTVPTSLKRFVRRLC
jgi:hypothetical protein